MKVRQVSVTRPIQDAIPGLDANASPEAVVVYCARVSNPGNQDNHSTGQRLLRYCIKHGHWSVFEMVDWCVEIETSRAIAAQLLRHKSLVFQEFSQRYSPTTTLAADFIQRVEMRPRGSTNRQGSNEVDHLPYPHVVKALVTNHMAACSDLYKRLLDEGVAPECARMVLPLATTTRLYAKGSLRSWIHYLQVRTSTHTQKEHRELAEEIRRHFAAQFPIIHDAAFTEHE